MELIVSHTFSAHYFILLREEHRVHIIPQFFLNSKKKLIITS